MMVRSTKMFRQVLQRPQPSSFITPLRVPVPRPIHHLAIHHETVEEMICRYVHPKVPQMRRYGGILDTSVFLGVTTPTVGTSGRP